ESVRETEVENVQFISALSSLSITAPVGRSTQSLRMWDSHQRLQLIFVPTEHELLSRSGCL
ncbi:hypothetical protein J6590_049525, partial [Homalodisca vitripennis]